MKIVQINAYGYGSTGTLMRQAHQRYLNDGVDSYIAWSRGPKPQGEREYQIGSILDVYVHAGLHRLLGLGGLIGSKRATEDLVRWLKEVDPDVIHLHNLHGYTINLPVLFDYLACCGKEIRWTLHDCWAFTGHCGYFTYVGCSQWQTGCGCSGRCPQAHLDPKTIAGTCAVKYSWMKKNELFNSIDQIKIITPSRWLAKLVNNSYLNKHQVDVVRNVIDQTVFYPTSSDLRNRYDLTGKFIILGVAAPWSARKGLGDFINLSHLLDERFKIVLIGLNERQRKSLPESILGLGRTNSQRELAEWYTVADVFAHLSYEDNYPTVVLEARACGTPVVAYDACGTPEAAGTGATLVAPGDVAAVSSAIKGYIKDENEQFNQY